MDLQIKYQNELGENITPQQAEQLKNYSKITLNNGNIKFIENTRTIKSGIKKSISYFLDNEDKNQIIFDYATKPKYKLAIYLNKAKKNDFTLYDIEEYSQDGALIYKGKTTFDSNMRSIFYCQIDLITGAAHNFRKHYYGFSKNANSITELLRFEYFDNGQLEYITDPNMEFGEMWPISLSKFLNDEKFSQQDFPWSQHPYYHAATPYLPDGSL